MKKRRRAYKKYDWRGHQFELYKKMIHNLILKRVMEEIDHMVLYGVKND